MVHRSSAIHQIIQSLNNAQSEKFSGRLILTPQGGAPWFFDFQAGILVWVNQRQHRNRRWLRIIRQRCPTFFKQHWSREFTLLKDSGEFIGEYWSLTLLKKSLQAGFISSEKIQSILQAYLLEAITALSANIDLTAQWVSKGNIPQALVIPSFQTTIQTGQKWQKQWAILCQKYEIHTFLSQFSLDFAPAIVEYSSLQEQVDPLVFGQLSKLLTGKNTFWDISSLLQQDWISLTCVLLPLLRAGSLEIKTVEDIDLSEFYQQQKAEAISSRIKSRGVIACIDDSPVIAKELERILQPFGFEVLSITDPLKGFSTLMKAKPRLIFLDLVMPNTNGYEICTFLRKSPQFKDLPIVMLTGHDGIVDRLRAKMVGSTDFLGKPPEATRVLQVLEKHLKETLISQPVSKTRSKLKELPA